MQKRKKYFSHDMDAREDPKVIAMMMRHGWKSYGIYWGIIEVLGKSEGYKFPKDFKNFKKFLKISSEQLLNSIIFDFGLFEFDEKFFWSESLKRRMLMMEYKSRIAAASVYHRYNKRTASNIKGVAEILRSQVSNYIRT